MDGLFCFYKFDVLCNVKKPVLSVMYCIKTIKIECKNTMSKAFMCAITNKTENKQSDNHYVVRRDKSYQLHIHRRIENLNNSNVHSCNKVVKFTGTSMAQYSNGSVCGFRYNLNTVRVTNSTIKYSGSCLFNID